jgi:hypothetical protein
LSVCLTAQAVKLSKASWACSSPQSRAFFATILPHAEYLRFSFNGLY